MSNDRMLDEEQLRQRVAAAFDRLPEPELPRLRAVEGRLVDALPRPSARRRPTVGWYWWLIGALAASGAAAWWAGEHIYTDSSVPDPVQQAPATEDASRSAPADAAREHPGGSSKPDSRTDESPTIYRKEIY